MTRWWVRSRRQLGAFWARLDIDRRDALIFLGIAGLGYGLHQYQPPLAFVVLGALLVYWGLFHPVIVERLRRP